MLLVPGFSVQENTVAWIKGKPFLMDHVQKYARFDLQTIHTYCSGGRTVILDTSGAKHVRKHSVKTNFIIAMLFSPCFVALIGDTITGRTPTR